MAKPKAGDAAQNASQNGSKTQRAKAVPQSAFPMYGLEKTLQIAQTIVDQFGGRGGDPNHIALAMKWTPTGGAWRMLCGSAVAYGLTDGGYAASEIKLTPRGSTIVMPTEENADKPALRDALMEPTIMRAFIEKYDGNKFPSKEIAINVLAQLGLPRERCADAFDVLQDNLRFVGALQQTKTGYMVLMSMIGSALVGGNGQASGTTEDEPDTPPDIPTMPKVTPAATPPLTAPAPDNTNVFITHGKNRDLLEHLKKLVTFVKFNPVVSVEVPDTSKPVPQKVLDEMRSCFGGIVHVRSEGVWTDADGKQHPKINDNVLIEIGAAMMKYKDNFILLVERGVTLPSNLQGLYVCHYEGEHMDGDATMRLLEGLNKFKPNA